MHNANSGVRPASAFQYVPSQSERRDEEATEFLAKAGYRADGRPKGERSTSVRAISTPCGGKPGSWSKGK